MTADEFAGILANAMEPVYAYYDDIRAVAATFAGLLGVFVGIILIYITLRRW